MSAEAIIVGIHLLTAHDPSSYAERPIVHAHKRAYNAAPLMRKYEVFNPGVYVIHPSGATAGAIINSYGDPAAYAGWTLRHDRFALTLGGIVGYERAAVLPLIAPSVKFGAARISLSRGIKSTAIHLSLEKELLK